MSAFPPDSLQAPLLATLFPVVKSVMHGPGTMTAKPMSALSITSALCASSITKPKPVLNGNIHFHHVAKTPGHRIDYHLISSHIGSSSIFLSLSANPHQSSIISASNKSSWLALHYHLSAFQRHCQLLSACSPHQARSYPPSDFTSYQTPALSRTKRLYPSFASTLCSPGARIESSVTGLP